MKILKNETNIVELAVEIEKSNSKRFQSCSKLIPIKYKHFRDFREW